VTRTTGAGAVTPRVATACAVLLIAASFALYLRSPLERPWYAGNHDPADYRFVAEYFWGVPILPVTYDSQWRGPWADYLRNVPFRGIGLGTMYLGASWLRLGHAPTSEAEVGAAGWTLVAFEKTLLGAALLVLFNAVRRRWGPTLAIIALTLTAFPPQYWRLTNDFLVEPVDRILFILAFACVVAMRDRRSVERLSFALMALFFVAAQLKVQWLLAAFLMLPLLLWKFRSSGVRLATAIALCAAALAIPLSVVAVNWIGWRTGSLNAGIGIHLNLKYHGRIVQTFAASRPQPPAFVDPRSPRLNWWDFHVGSDVRRDDYVALDRFAEHHIRTHPDEDARAFWEGLTLASTLPGLQQLVDGRVRYEPLAGTLGSIVRVADVAVWVLLVAGLLSEDTRLVCALALVLWIVPAVGNIVSLYEVRYHLPMAGLGAVAACAVLAQLVQHSGRVDLLVRSTAVQ